MINSSNRSVVFTFRGAKTINLAFKAYYFYLKENTWWLLHRNETSSWNVRINLLFLLKVVWVPTEQGATYFALNKFASMFRIKITLLTLRRK